MRKTLITLPAVIPQTQRLMGLKFIDDLTVPTCRQDRSGSNADYCFVFLRTFTHTRSRQTKPV